MKNAVFFLCYVIVFLSSCSFPDDGPEIVTKKCEAFDFSIPETEWIILAEGTNYTFEGGGKTIELVSDYSTSEAYIFRYERKIRLIPLPPSPNRDCFSNYTSFHNSINRETGIFNKETSIQYTIGIENNGERVDMFMGFDDISFKMEIVKDTISIDGGSFLGEDFEPFAFENFSSMSLANRNFQNVVTITNQNIELQPQKIYLAKNIGLFAFEKKDTLWLRN